MAWQALYLAAATYRPGKQGFHRWLRVKIAGQTANFRRLLRRREVSGVRVHEYRDGAVDSRYYYCD